MIRHAALFTLACAVAGWTSPQVRADVIDGRTYEWRILGKKPSSLPDEVQIDMSFDTEAAADAELPKWEYTYYNPNGELYSSKDKPIKGSLRVTAWDVAAGKYADPPPRVRKPGKGRDPQDPPRDTPPGGSKGSVARPAGARDADAGPLAGRQGRGRIGSKAVSIKFIDKKNFVISGEVDAKGEYTQTLNVVRLVTARGSVFFGTMEGDTITGGARVKPDGQKERDEKWSVELAPLAGDTEAAPKPAEDRASFILWYGGTATYGGMTLEEAIQGGRDAKRRNPNVRIRVTAHANGGNKTITEISNTPGKVVLDLP
jgi:hypothetical protein